VVKTVKGLFVCPIMLGGQILDHHSHQSGIVKHGLSLVAFFKYKHANALLRGDAVLVVRF
jgi:hypothetical protein